MVGKEGIKTPFGHTERFVEHGIEIQNKCFVTTDHRGIVLIVIIAGTQATIVTVIHRLDELAVLILRMEETGIGVEQVAVVVGFAQVMCGFVSLTQFGCDL